MSNAESLGLPKDVCGYAFARDRIANANSGEAFAESNGGVRPGAAEHEPSYREQACGACAGSVIVRAKNIIVGPDECRVSTSCEKIWVGLYPEEYLDEGGNPEPGKLPCGGVDCRAKLRLTASTGVLEATECSGEECKVDREGPIYWTKGRFALDHMPLTSPDQISRDDSVAMTPVVGLPDHGVRTAEPPADAGWIAI